MTGVKLALDELARTIGQYPVQFAEWLTEDALNAFVTKNIISLGCVAAFLLLVAIIFLVCGVNCHKRILAANGNRVDIEYAVMGRCLSFGISAVAFLFAMVAAVEMCYWIFVPDAQILGLLI